MSGVDYSTVRKRVQRLKGGDNLELKTAEILTVKGLQVVTLVPANLIFKWAMGDNPDLSRVVNFFTTLTKTIAQYHVAVKVMHRSV